MSTSSLAPFVHPQALCESLEVGAGTRIWAFAHVMKGARVGTDCNVGDHAFIESGAVVGNRVTVKNQVMIWDGVTIEDEVFLGPGVTFTNDACPRSPRMAGVPEIAARYHEPSSWLLATRICRGATLGARAVVLPGVTVGAYAFVAAGALVTKNVPPHALVLGHPARPRGWVCRCGMRLHEDVPGTWSCRACPRHYLSDAASGGLSLR